MRGCETENCISHLARAPDAAQVFNYCRNSLCNLLWGTTMQLPAPHFTAWFHKVRFSASCRKAHCQHIANKVVAHHTCAILKYTAECAKFPYLAKQPICFQDLWPSIFRPKSSFASNMACSLWSHQPGFFSAVYLNRVNIYIYFKNPKQTKKKIQIKMSNKKPHP